MISISGTPRYNYHPAYSDVTFYVDSTNKTEPGFRYVFDIYSAGTSTLLASFDDIPPTGLYGFGVQHIDSTLSDYLSANRVGTSIPDSWIRYNIEFGEKQTGSWDYNDYEFFSSTGTSNGHVLLRQFASATTHTYNIGDQVNIVQEDGGVIKPALNGLHTVIDVPSPYGIVIELIFGNIGSGPTISGVTTYANNQPSITRGLASISGLTAFNGYNDFEDLYFDASQYVMSGTSADKKFLTSFPNNSRVTENCDLWFNYISDYQSSASTKPFLLVFGSSQGDVVAQNIQSITTANPIAKLPVGPNNMNPIIILSGTSPVIKDETTWYSFAITNQAGIQISEQITINIDKTCGIDYEQGPLILSFIDRLGSTGSFEMKGRMKVFGTNEKSKYTRQRGGIDLANRTWSHDYDDKGTTTYASMKSRRIELNTGFLTQDEAKYFSEIYDSGFVWLKWNGQYYAVDIVETDYEQEQEQNKRLITKKITLVFSNKLKINV